MRGLHVVNAMPVSHALLCDWTLSGHFVSWPPENWPITLQEGAREQDGIRIRRDGGNCRDLHPERPAPEPASTWPYLRMSPF